MPRRPKPKRVPQYRKLFSTLEAGESVLIETPSGTDTTVSRRMATISVDARRMGLRVTCERIYGFDVKSKKISDLIRVTCVEQLEQLEAEDDERDEPGPDKAPARSAPARTPRTPGSSFPGV